MTEIPMVSVIIPTYNRAHIVGRALASVVSQTYRHFEVVVVDDGSGDDTRDIVERFREHRLRYVRHGENRGCPAARNTGIEMARGEYIAFLDSDDEWLPVKLEKQVRLLQSEPSVGVVYAGYEIARGQGDASVIRLPKFRGAILDDLLCGNRIGGPSTVMVRRECFRRVGLFDPMMAFGDDWDMWIRLARHYSFDCVPEVLVRYYVDDSGRMTRNLAGMLDGHLWMARKFLEDASRYSSRQRARHLFALGRRLVGLGYTTEDAEAKRLGRELLFKALRARPSDPTYLVHYGASHSKTTYRVVTGARPRLEGLLARLAGFLAVAPRRRAN